jgi:integrase
MNEELEQVLQEWKTKCPISDKNLVFPNTAGNYHNPANLNRRVFHPLIKKAGVKKIKFHDLRHTFTSLLILQKQHPSYIQNQLGHSTIQMTMDIYGHLLPEVHEQGVNALNSILKPNVTKMSQNGKILKFPNRRNPCQ